ncbi:MAG: hypothetical protein HC912_03115, partial [Saprospiraceae bacterium]|nr:hypothetical protein [Saprospiraceae bacterium]
MKDIEITLDKIRQMNIRSGENNDETQKLDDKRREYTEEIGRKKQKIEDLIFDIEVAKKAIEAIKREITK